MSIPELLVRVIVTIVVLLTMARLNGPKQISQMSFYDYVAGITVGSLAASVSTNNSLPIENGLIAIVLFLSASLFMGWLTNKSMGARRLLTGQPIVLVKGGRLIWKGMKKARIDMNELLANLRYGGYFNFSDVEDVILETTGKISIRPKSFARPPKMSEMKIQAPAPLTFTEMVIGGVVLRENLTKAGKDEKWLSGMLKGKGVNDTREVALATLDSNGALSVVKKEI